MEDIFIAKHMQASHHFCKYGLYGKPAALARLHLKTIFEATFHKEVKNIELGQSYLCNC